MIIDSPIISGSQSASGPLNQIGNVQITGSLSVTGTINGSITGSVTSASYATTAEFLDGLDSTSFVFTSSFNDFSGSTAGRITNLEAFSSSLDATFATDASVSASILVLSQSVQASEAALSSSYTIMSGSYASASGSLSIRTSNLEATSSTLVSASSSFAADSASLSTRLTTDETNITTLTNASASFAVVSSSFATTSGSLSTRVTIIEGQDATTGSNTFTGPQFMSEASNAISFTSTASLYTDGGLRVAKDSFVSGTAYFNNITVYGTSSIQYITSSQVDIGANIITVNTDTPAVRFGGLAVFDSGSTQLTGSMLWDSETNHWVYSNPSGSTYSGGMIMSGPRASSLGTEQGTTFNALMKGQGGDHITSSQLIDDGTTVRIPGNLQVTGSLSGSSAVFSSALAANNLTGEGQAGAGGVLNLRQDAIYIPKGNGYSSIASSFSVFEFYGYTGASTYKNFTFGFNGLTDNTRRDYTLPDGSGTLALTGDLINYVTLGTNQSISGTKTFSSPLTGSSAIFSSRVIVGDAVGSSPLVWARSGGATGYLYSDGDNVGITNVLDFGAGYEGILLNSSTSAINFYTNGVSTPRLTIASTGAATFSSTLTTGGKITANGGGLLLDLVGGSDTFSRVTGNRGNGDNLHVSNIEFYNSFSSRLVGEMRGITGAGGTQSNSGQLAFYTNDNGTYAERMKIYSEGQIGIKGAATTEAAYALFTNDANTGFFNIFAGGSGTATKGIKLKVTNGSSTIDAMTITSGGRVGIGSTAPDYKFVSYTAGNTSSAGAMISADYYGPIIGTVQNSSGYYAFKVVSSLTNPSVNATGAVDLFVVRADGNVTIGPTSLPSGAVEFTNGSLFTSNNIFVNNSSGTAGYAVRLDGFTNNLYILWSNGSGIDQGGVGLGYGATSWSPVSSDARTKKNFETTQGLTEILQIEPIKYHLLSDEDDTVKRLGFKAQNLESLIPEMVHKTGKKLEDGSDILTITPDYILPVLVKAIQEMNTKFEEQQAMITSLQEQINELKNK